MHQYKQFNNEKVQYTSIPDSKSRTDGYPGLSRDQLTNGSREVVDNLAEPFGKIAIRSSFESLPNELLRKIFGYIHDEIERVSRPKLAEIGSTTFHRLCLVSRRIYPVAREFLYRTVVVTDKQLFLLYRQLMRDEAAHSLIRNFMCVSDLTPDTSIHCGSMGHTQLIHSKLVQTSLTAVTCSRDLAKTANMQRIHKMHAELMRSMPCFDVLLGVTYILLHCMPRVGYLVLHLPIPPLFDSLQDVNWFWGRLWSRTSFASLSKEARRMAPAYVETTAATVQTAPKVISAKRAWDSDSYSYSLDNALAAPAPWAGKILSSLRYMFLSHHWKGANVQFPVVDWTEYKFDYPLRGKADASLRELPVRLTASVSDWRGIQALWLSTAQNTNLRTLSVMTPTVAYLHDPAATSRLIEQSPGVLTPMDAALSRWTHSLRTLHLDCMFSQPLCDTVYGNPALPPALYSIAAMSHLRELTITTEAAFGDPWDMSDQMNQFDDPVDDDADAADAFLARRLPASLEILTIVEWWSMHVPRWPRLELPGVYERYHVDAMMADFLCCAPHILGRTHPRLKQLTMVGLCAVVAGTGELLYDNSRHWVDSSCAEDYAKCFHEIGVRLRLQLRLIQVDDKGNLTQEIDPSEEVMEA
ncbi:uncharacterized protein E0L32_000497 [Thyridium curvatum]|uniref:Uncharacterized protein n=1 Tax=Thyridium curvatum TaxID=1093900 RepID=A0A507B2K8_9PEZI|nr:uncharacterized protein E0L32_000497 [Thyridium curvatum]TPX14103.1 hypothetical protein E0L32_000497 [Thyridium curvatum]